MTEQRMRLEATTSADLDAWVIRHAERVLQRLSPVWIFTVKGEDLICICDSSADRMRVMAQVVKVDRLDSSIRERMLQANFDTCLDARYAIAHDMVWSVFLHPLSSLIERDFLSALRQVTEAKRTFGLTYSSGEVVFGGGDSTAD